MLARRNSWSIHAAEHCSSLPRNGVRPERGPHAWPSLEPADRHALGDPFGSIVEPGGDVLIASSEDRQALRDQGIGAPEAVDAVDQMLGARLRALSPRSSAVGPSCAR